jgi:hypothetical protein
LFLHCDVPFAQSLHLAAKGTEVCNLLCNEFAKLVALEQEAVSFGQELFRLRHDGRALKKTGRIIAAREVTEDPRVEHRTPLRAVNGFARLAGALGVIASRRRRPAL